MNGACFGLSWGQDSLSQDDWRVQAQVTPKAITIPSYTYTVHTIPHCASAIFTCEKAKKGRGGADINIYRSLPGTRHREYHTIIHHHYSNRSNPSFWITLFFSSNSCSSFFKLLLQLTVDLPPFRLHNHYRISTEVWNAKRHRTDPYSGYLPLSPRYLSTSLSHTLSTSPPLRPSWLHYCITTFGGGVLPHNTAHRDPIK